MPKPFKLQSTRTLPPDADIIQHDGKPHVRLRERNRTVLFPLTKDGKKYLRPSKCWYFEFRDANGTVKRKKGFTDLKATEQAAAEMERRVGRIRVGMIDPAEEHFRRPLVDHLAEYAAHLEAKGDTPRHVKMTADRIRAMFTGAGFVFLRDVEPSKANDWLNALRQDEEPVKLPDGVESFTPKEVATLLGITRSSVGEAVRRLELATVGNGRARRIPRSTVEALAAKRAKGCGPQQRNHYVRAVRGFFRWLVKAKRVGANPLDALGFDKATAEDIRHARRELTADELRRLFDATRASTLTFRGLTGEDRYALYLTAAGIGFRATALANLTPEQFDLTANTATLPAKLNKSRKTKVQPIPSDVAAELVRYFAGKPAGQPIWGGTWAEKGAEMLRIDLDAAGIAYAVNGPNGPEHADFHALRHSYLTLLGNSGADTRTVQELAGHSSPVVTARYMHKRHDDLAGAVGKLPSLVSGVAGGGEIRVVPGVVTGGISGHSPAPSGTPATIRGQLGDVAETPEKEAAGARKHRPASSRIEWAVPGLNRGPSDFQSKGLLPTKPFTFLEL